MTNNNERLTQVFHRAQASDYSRKLAYREERNHLRLNFADVLLILFAGIMGTLFIALIVG